MFNFIFPPQGLEPWTKEPESPVLPITPRWSKSISPTGFEPVRTVPKTVALPTRLRGSKKEFDLFGPSYPTFTLSLPAGRSSPTGWVIEVTWVHRSPQHYLRSNSLSGAAGFEPTASGFGDRCVTITPHPYYITNLLQCFSIAKVYQHNAIDL